MRRTTALALAIGCAVAALACEVGPRSGRGLRLPEGDITRGQLAFRELGCGRCHAVAGDTAAPTGEASEISVVLGGEVSRVETHGQLVTSIVNPSHRISRRYPAEEVARGDVSKMENFNDRMTVAQLIDLVSYLQSKYELRHEPLYVP